MNTVLTCLRRWIGLVVALLLSWSAPVQATELIILESRPGVQLKILVLQPESKPKGVIVAYPGGEGTLGLDTQFGRPIVGNKSYAEGFLIRNRDQFVKAGYALLLPDVPSDRQKLDYLYRLGENQIDDAIAVMDYAQKRFGVAPWMIGISASSMTVASLAANPHMSLGGIVLMASVTTMPSSYGAYRTHPEGTASTRLAEIKVPALVVTHRDDACELSPPADSAKIIGRMIASPRKAERVFEGGSRPRSGPCFALSPHGFLGIEGEVEQAIFDFIEKPGS